MSKPRLNRDAYLRLLARAVWGVGSRATRSGDFCILATRVALDVLALTRPTWKARPFSVRVSAYNAAAYALFNAGTLWKGNEDAWDAAGAYSVGVGFPKPHDREVRWQGHLALLVDEQWLVDPTLGQADRPQWGLVFGPQSFRVPPAFVAGKAAYSITNDRSAAIYTPAAGNRGWKTAPDWTRRGKDAGIALFTKHVVELLEQAEARLLARERAVHA